MSKRLAGTLRLSLLPRTRGAQVRLGKRGVASTPGSGAPRHRAGDRERDVAVGGPWMRSQPLKTTRIGASVIWLAFIVFPLIDAIEQREPTLSHVAVIAAALFLSPGTVRNHLSSAMQKLDARNRAEAIRRAEDHGWI